jgi:hypothetical protein
MTQDSYSHSDPPLQFSQPPAKSSIFPSNSDLPHSITLFWTFSECYTYIPSSFVAKSEFLRIFHAFLPALPFLATPPREMAARSSQQPAPHVIPMNNVNDTGVLFSWFLWVLRILNGNGDPPLRSQQRAAKPSILPSDSDSQHSFTYLCEFPEISTLISVIFVAKSEFSCVLACAKCHQNIANPMPYAPNRMEMRTKPLWTFLMVEPMPLSMEEMEKLTALMITVLCTHPNTVLQQQHHRHNHPTMTPSQWPSMSRKTLFVLLALWPKTS